MNQTHSAAPRSHHVAFRVVHHRQGVATVTNRATLPTSFATFFYELYIVGSPPDYGSTLAQGSHPATIAISEVRRSLKSKDLLGPTGSVNSKGLADRVSSTFDC